MQGVDGVFVDFYTLTAGSGLTQILHASQGFFDQFRYALLIEIDSSNELDLDYLSDYSLELISERGRVGNAIFVDSPGFVSLIRDGYFAGFDEVWFLTLRPDDAAALLHVPDIERFAEMPLGVPTVAFVEVQELMRRTGAKLGLYDGYGLQYVTTDIHLARDLDKIFGDQKGAG